MISNRISLMPGHSIYGVIRFSFSLMDSRDKQTDTMKDENTFTTIMYLSVKIT